ncbi:MAG: sulfurtransferase [Deltaproteobacteria bacterium]|jgi:rhodanese-related sulfurtransferase|nr:sulfurtransferase [Deltaproteobacteria bacterium]
MREFSATELRGYLEAVSTKPLLLDVREPWEFEKACIEGSTLAPMRTIPERMQELNPEQEIVVICHHGIRSRMIGLYLENHGFSRIINLTGGVEAWAREVDPHMATY